MLKEVCLLALLMVWCGLASADFSIRVVDTEGNPVADAVVSIPASLLASPSQTTSSAQNPAIMDQINKQFSPHVLVVNKQQQVIFPNSDQVRHHVYSFSKPNDFEIRLYSGDQADPVVFEHAGIVVLGCNIHDQMLAYLYVVDNEIAMVTNEQGMAVFQGALPKTLKTLELSIWHSRLSSSRVERLIKTLPVPALSSVNELKIPLIPEPPKAVRKFKPGLM